MSDRQTDNQTTDDRQLKLTDLGLLTHLEDSKHIAVRLDQIDDFDVNTYIEYIHKQEDKLRLALICQETSTVVGKVHYHAYLKYKDVNVKIPSIQKDFNRKFPHKKSTYAITEVKNVGSYIAYICKDKNPLYMYNITKELINEVSSLWIDDTTFKKCKKKGSNRIDELYKAYLAEHQGTPFELLKLKKFVIRYFINNKIIFNEFQVIGYIKSLWGMLQYDDFESALIERMEKSF